VASAAETWRTEANVPTEIVFTAQRPHADPFNEVTLDVAFSDAAGTTRKVPAFWAGGARWRVRYASPLVGAHRWESACSDAEDAGLHAVRGTVEVVPCCRNIRQWLSGRRVPSAALRQRQAV